MAERHIVAMGGGGFSNDDRLLDDFILGLARRPRPRVCFLPTATGDDPGYVVLFYEALVDRCEPSHLELFSRSVTDLRAFVLGQDVVYVGGGNTASMLGVWRAHGLDEVLREAWEEGVVLAGISAGAICWFEAGVTDSFGPELAALHDGLGLLGGSACPHFDAEPQRRPAYHRLVADGFPPGLAADNFAAFHFAGTDFAEVVASRAGAQGYRVEKGEGGVSETPLPARLLA